MAGENKEVAAPKEVEDLDEYEGSDGDSDIDNLLYSRRSVENHDGLSLLEGLAISLNFNLGFSILAFPFHISRAGWSGLIAYFAALFTTYVTALFLVQITRRYPELNSFASIGVKGVECVLGENSYYAKHTVKLFFRAFQHLDLYLFLVLNFLVVKESLGELDLNIGAKVNKEVLLVLISVTLLFPMAVFTINPHWLSKEAVLSTLSFQALFGLVVFTGAITLTEGENFIEDVKFFPEEPIDFYASFGGILLMFGGHAIYPSIASDLKKKDQAYAVVHYTYLILAIMSLALCFILIVGYDESNISALPTAFLEPDSLQNTLGQTLMILKMVLQYPALLYPMVVEFSILFYGMFQDRCTKSKSDAEDILEAEEAAAGLEGEEKEMFEHISAVSPGFALQSVKSFRLQKLEELKLFAGPVQSQHIGVFSASETANLRLGASVIPKKFQLLVGFVLSLFSLAAGLIIPDLSFLLSLGGAVFGISLSLILPSISYLAIMPCKEYPVQNAVAFLLLGAGVVSTIISLIPVLQPDKVTIT